jgi:membrane-bound lytic murein transglycosylase B
VLLSLITQVMPQSSHRKCPRWWLTGAAALFSAVLAVLTIHVAAGTSSPAAAAVEPQATASSAPPAPLAAFLATPSEPVGASSSTEPAAHPTAPRPTPEPVPPLPAASGLAADGIPQTAFDAYVRAARRARLDDPGCGLTWPLLAGIGRVESDHGRFAGAVLRTNGISTPPVIGIALDGNGTALIRDTDHGRLDGDRVYDHAVGPMQFIPSTWAIFGTDGNGDGVVDPFNIYDAAAAAAHYLCAAGGNLATFAGERRAVLAYNHSSAYFELVYGVARIYATDAHIPLVGPPPAHPGKARAEPPADPGRPTGVRAGPPNPPPSSSPASASPTPASPTPTPTSSSSSSSSDPSGSTSAPTTPAPTTSTDVPSTTPSPSPSASPSTTPSTSPSVSPSASASAATPVAPSDSTSPSGP